MTIESKNAIEIVQQILKLLNDKKVPIFQASKILDIAASELDRSPFTIGRELNPEYINRWFLRFP